VLRDRKNVRRDESHPSAALEAKSGTGSSSNRAEGGRELSCACIHDRVQNQRPRVTYRRSFLEGSNRLWGLEGASRRFLGHGPVPCRQGIRGPFGVSLGPSSPAPEDEDPGVVRRSWSMPSTSVGIRPGDPRCSSGLE
jgi:hypothetical protein